MLLRGMHDHGCDDIFIIVTDMKRAEMDAATEYFKFVCQYTFGQTVKQDTEREIHYRRERTLICVHPTLLTSPGTSRCASQAYIGAPATHTLLPPNRPHLPRNPVRATSAVHSTLLAPDDLLLANILHAPSLRPHRRHFLRFPIGLPQPVLHRGLRNDTIP